MSRASAANPADLSRENLYFSTTMPFNFSSPEFLSHHKMRKNRVSPVSRASPAHMNSPLVNALPKVVAFLLILQFPSTRNVDRAG